MHSAQTKSDVKWFKKEGPGTYRVTLERFEMRKIIEVVAEDRLDATLRAERLHPGWHMVATSLWR